MSSRKVYTICQLIPWLWSVESSKETSNSLINGHFISTLHSNGLTINGDALRHLTISIAVSYDLKWEWWMIPAKAVVSPPPSTSQDHQSSRANTKGGGGRRPASLMLCRGKPTSNGDMAHGGGQRRHPNPAIALQQRRLRVCTRCAQGPECR